MNLDEFYTKFLSNINESMNINEAAKKNPSYIIKENLYPIVERVLSTKPGDTKFKHMVGKYIDANSSKLFTAGPTYMIPFGDVDKASFYNIFNIKNPDKEITSLVKQVIKKTTNSSSDFKLLTNNPIFWLFYCVIRFYTIKKDEKGIQSALTIYALAAYPAIYSKFFKYGADEGVMQYTMDKLTNKYLMKQAKHVFGGLTLSINNSYKFLKPHMEECDDSEIIRFIQRIRNDQKSMLYNIFAEYMKNYKLGNKVVVTMSDNSDDIAVDDEVENNTSVIETTTLSVMNMITTSGLDISKISAARSIAGVSLSDLRFYLSKIIIDKNTKSIEKFIQSILFLYLYTEHKTIRDIHSSYFLTWASQIFRKTNSTDDNIACIRETLDTWANESGITDKFKRVASLSCYKKAIFWYFILVIQSYVK